MGNIFAAASSLPDPNTNPNPSQDSIPMTPSSEIPETQESKPPTETLESSKTQEPETPVQGTQHDQGEVGRGEEEEEEGEGECPFCLYMKAGECREPFIGWEKCVEEGEKNKEDIVDKCHEVTAALKKCMEAHPDHYGPILNAEKAAEKEAIREMEKVKAEENALINDLKKEHEESEPSDNRDKLSESS